MFRLEFRGEKVPVRTADLKMFTRLADNQAVRQRGVYRIEGDIPPDVFEQFLAYLLDNTPVNVTTENYPGLKSLCDELGYSKLAEELEPFGGSLGAIEGLTQRVEQLESEQRSAREQIQRLTALCETLRSQVEQLQAEASSASDCSWRTPVPPPLERVLFNDKEGRRQLGLKVTPGMTVIQAKEELARMAGWNPADTSIIDDYNKMLLEDDENLEKAVRAIGDDAPLRVAFINYERMIPPSMAKRVERQLPGQGRQVYLRCGSDIDVFLNYRDAHY